MKTLLILLGSVVSPLRGAEGLNLRTVPFLGRTEQQRQQQQDVKPPLTSCSVPSRLLPMAPATMYGISRMDLLRGSAKNCLLATFLLGPSKSAAAAAAAAVGMPATMAKASSTRLWSASPLIDAQGFLQNSYSRVDGIPWDWETKLLLQLGMQAPLSPAKIRQVPGDGNCLFHAISTCMAAPLYPDDTIYLLARSALLRQQSMARLRQENTQLYLQGNEYVKTADLINDVAALYGCTPSQYLDAMEQDVYWGDEASVWAGGPELVALSNVLKVPIHLYELRTARSNHDASFVLQRIVCYGSPKFNDKEAFHLLIADSRFPDVSPGEQEEKGNHFLAVFPM